MTDAGVDMEVASTLPFEPLALLAGVVEVVGCISSLEAWGWAGASPAASDEETFSEETA